MSAGPGSQDRAREGGSRAQEASGRLLRSVGLLVSDLVGRAPRAPAGPDATDPWGPRDPAAFPGERAAARRAAQEAAARRTGRSRVTGLMVILGMLMLGSGARAVQLAVDPDPRILELATEKRYAAGIRQGPRGEIVDARGELLAKSVLNPAIVVDAQTLWNRTYARVESTYLRARASADAPVDAAAILRDASARLTEIANWLAPQLEMDPAELDAIFRSDRQYVRLRSSVHPAVADAIVASGLTSDGLIVEENYRRFYPQGTIAGQVVGYVDGGGEGVQGVERSMDTYLSGSRAREVHRVNRYGALLDAERDRELGMRGNRVVLTIEGRIQADLERALASVLEQHRPLWAAGVVMEVRTGRIVAMASAPSFDPNHPGAQDFALMRNRAILDPVEPGSVFKVFTYSAALEEGLVRPDEMFRTPSPFQVGDKLIRDDHPHAAMTAAEIIKYSSNVGAAQLAARLGPTRLLSYYEAFGFGEVTGVPLPEEKPGQRSPPRVGKVETATISYGQGVTATLMQLVSATAAVANGGVRMQPLLVDRVEDADGDVIRAWSPTVVAQVISPETAALVTEAMATVTQDDSTAPRARIPGYRVAGKTGTAYKVVDRKYSSTARYSSFIGFAPVEDPVYAAAILVDEPSMGVRFGGLVAAPVFPEVVGPALLRKGVPQDPTVPGARGATGGSMEEPGKVVAALRDGADGAPAGPVQLVWAGEGWIVPDLTGRDARTALAGLQGAGVAVRVDGTGFVSSQTPAPGALLRPGDVVDLVLSP